MRAILPVTILLLLAAPSAAAAPVDCSPDVACVVEETGRTVRELLECTCPPLTQELQELVAYAVEEARELVECLVNDCFPPQLIPFLVETTAETVDAVHQTVCDQAGCA